MKLFKITKLHANQVAVRTILLCFEAADAVFSKSKQIFCK